MTHHATHCVSVLRRDSPSVSSPMTKHSDVYRRTERSRSQSTGEVDPSFVEVEVVL